MYSLPLNHQKLYSIYTNPQELSPPVCTISTEVLQPILTQDRVKEVFSKNLPIVNNQGQELINVQVSQFLTIFIEEMQAIQVNPKAIEAIGGAVAYMIGPEKAAAYAKAKHINDPNLAEFNRLQDLDIAVDLTNYP